MTKRRNSWGSGCQEEDDDKPWFLPRSASVPLGVRKRSSSCEQLENEHKKMFNWVLEDEEQTKNWLSFRLWRISEEELLTRESSSDQWTSNTQKA